MLSQSERKHACESLTEFFQSFIPSAPRQQPRDLDELQVILASHGLTIGRFREPAPEVVAAELAAAPAPFPAAPESGLNAVAAAALAPRPAQPTAQQLAARLPAIGHGPRRLTDQERQQVNSYASAADELRHHPGYCFKSDAVLTLVRLVRSVSGETGR